MSCACALAMVAAFPVRADADSQSTTIGINVLLNGDVTDAALADLARHGQVLEVMPEIDAVTLRAAASKLGAIQALPSVATANPDAVRRAGPVDTVLAQDFSAGISSWDQDIINVTVRPHSSDRAVPYDGTGVYVAVLDTGLVDSWRQYFPEERMATQWAKAFSGGGQNRGVVSDVPNLWEHDQNSHGTHVTSTILGYRLAAPPSCGCTPSTINGTSPKATVIPVKVLGQGGFGSSSTIARGIVYVADLKASGALGSSPVVINMSLGGPSLDAVEKAAVDYAVAQGVVVVAAAGNSGEAGMDYPGAYPPVISVAAAGWTGQWQPGDDANPRNWWREDDVAEPTSASDLYIAEFSGRQKPGQDLDVAAPGAAVLGPYQTQSGKTSYFFLPGTSMATPHVAGIAALMMQKNGALAPGQVESILEGTAIPMGSGCRAIKTSATSDVSTVCWDASSGDADGAGFATADAALAA